MSSNGLSLEDEIEKEIENFEIDSDEEEIATKERTDNDFVSDSINVTTNSLLRATICELERALKDTRRLLFDRDKDNTGLRQELERVRKDLRRDQSLRRKLSEETDQKLKTFNEVQKMNEEMKQEIEELKNQLASKGAERHYTEEDLDDIVPCCSSMTELIQMRQKVKDIEKEFQDFKSNNQICDDYSLSSFKNKVNLVSNPSENRQSQKELQTQLRIKFLRDAFFYYMIDFHPDEQMKAILAILDYDDKRHDIIIESHKMKRQGKKFIVSEVSSRSLTFVQEQAR